MHQDEETIAVDIALIPPAEIRSEVGRINRTLIRRSRDRGVLLGPGGGIAHITLAMAPIRAADLTAVCDDLAEIWGRHRPLSLTLTGVSSVMTAPGHPVSGFDIAPAPPLRALHDEVVHGLTPFALSETAPGMLAVRKGEVPDRGFLDYIREFRAAHAGDRYSPHITLGVGDAGDQDTRLPLPYQFTTETVAVCHLGNGGTCLTVLGEVGGARPLAPLP
ncbi:2'-5' RNA ligase [Methanofollis sp. W23]|uniref:2'-5' RNA ligase family protein n=1 Tax=Methanofollis sp. W23 TaxID=2817849 RepID=UPI001AE1DD29|nr:2'-5' RNA ligase family protein [Methanofollis sp. W23]MBP2146750.1 2'-5' RNA ligase [Methanofollis sp. W23]